MKELNQRVVGQGARVKEGPLWPGGQRSHQLAASWCQLHQAVSHTLGTHTHECRLQCIKGRTARVGGATV
jgi:hypothetical protein